VAKAQDQIPYTASGQASETPIVVPPPDDNTRTVLVADDDAVTRARLSHLLQRNGYKVVIAEDGLAALALLETNHFPMVITDWSMPGLDGPQLCARIRALKSPLYTYVIMLTGKTEKKEVAVGLEAGADDFVTKPFDSGELLARLRVGRRLNEMQARMLETEKQLREVAERDGLTGVLNRRALDQRAHGAFSYFLRGGPSMSLAILDIDHFKSVNDRFGHQAGDAVLREIARRIADNLRGYDTVGRYGGEEFMLIYPDTPVDRGRAAAERIRQVITASPVEIGETSLKVTVSIGVVTIQAPFRGPLAKAIEMADEALYIGKKLGRDRVVATVLPVPDLPDPEGITTELPTQILGPHEAGHALTLKDVPSSTNSA
jgi:two-component system, cell cycle response regulator